MVLQQQSSNTVDQYTSTLDTFKDGEQPLQYNPLWSMMLQQQWSNTVDQHTSTLDTLKDREQPLQYNPLWSYSNSEATLLTNIQQL